MKKYFTRGLLFSAITFPIGWVTGIGPISDAKAAGYNGLTSTKSAAVIELGVPARNTLPLRIIPHGSPSEKVAPTMILENLGSNRCKN